MKYFLLLLFSIIFSFPSFCQAPNTWAQRSDLGYSTPNVELERTGAAGFAIGKRGFLGTGENASGKKNDFWEYNPATNIWTQKADFPGAARSEAVAFSIGNKGYFGTGMSAGGYTNDFYEYNPALNTWQAVASFPGNPRSEATGFSLGAKGYLGTGIAALGLKADFWEFDPLANSWLQKTSFPGVPRSGAVSFSLGGFGYIGSGNVNTVGSAVNDFYQYNPVTNLWVQKANIGSAVRASAISFVLGSKAFVLTGRVNNARQDDIWEYNDLTNTWTQRLGFFTYGGAKREGAVGFTIDNKGYCFWGFDYLNKYRSDVWQYTVNSSPVWNQMANIGNMGRTLAVAFNIGNKGYIGTGYNGTCKKDLWEFDPVTNSWSQKADLKGVARRGAVAFSIKNKGYVGMGVDDAYNYKDDFYEYDPATNEWKEIAAYIGGSFPVWSAGSGHYKAIGFCIGNKGYVTTKDLGIKEYDPITNTWTLKGYFSGFGRELGTGFSVGGKGYVGTGIRSALHSKDFWEFDPVTNTLTQKADVPGNTRREALGFSSGTKGYIGGGKDNITNYFSLYEYNPATNAWVSRASLPNNARSGAVAFAIGNKGFVGTGFDLNYNFSKELWEYTGSESYKDVAVIGLSGPNITGCGFSNQESISVSFSNIGTTTETTIPFGYSINGVPATVTPEAFSGSVNPNSAGTYTFNAKANLSQPGTYKIAIYSSLQNDINLWNDTAKFVITNYSVSGLPYIDFETPVTDVSLLRQEVRKYSRTGQTSFASYPPFITNLNGLALFTYDTTNWVTPPSGANPWVMNPFHFAAVYLCLVPLPSSAADSLWLTFDLNQLYDTSPANTNFRVTINGQQVGNTYRASGSSSQLNWRHYKVSLYSYRQAANIEIGFESSSSYGFTSNSAGNHIDNIRILKRLVTTAGKDLQKDEIKIYPNPGKGVFRLFLPKGKNLTLDVLDLSGRLLHHQAAHEGLNKVELPTMRSGLYLLKISSEKSSVLKKIIVE